MARPTKFTPEVAERIIEAVRGGNTRHDAAEYAGVNAATVRRWLVKGRKQRSGALCAFCAALKKAEAVPVVESVSRIRRAAEGGQLIRRTVTTRRDGTVIEDEHYSQGQWTADAWWLERKRGEDWGQMRETIRDLAREIEDLKKHVRRNAVPNGPRPAPTPRRA